MRIFFNFTRIMDIVPGYSGHNTSRHRNTSLILQRAIQLSSITISFVGLAVLIGWIMDIPALTSLIPNSVTMKFSTAVSFIFTGVSILIISKLAIESSGYSDLSHIVLPISMLIILLFMSTHIGSIIVSAPSGVDNLFVKEQELDPVLTASPGRPSFPTMINFLLIAAAAAGTLITSGSNLKKLIGGTGFAIGIIGSVALAGYALSLPMLYYSFEGLNTAMAIHSAALFVVAGLVLIISGKIGFRREVEIPIAYDAAHNSAWHSISNNKTISLRTKFVCLFLAISIIPIFFIGGISLSNSKIYSATVLENSIEILGIATAISVAFFAAVISKSILQPIMSLRRAARKIACGDYDVNVDLHSGDEIGELASDFEKMKESVVSTNRNLERLVELRTLELNEANKKLSLSNTQLVGANEKLAKQDKIMHDFINIAAHELKSPITPILLATSLAQPKDEDKQVTLSKDAFDMIVSNARRLKRLAGDILDVARIESNFLDIHKQNFELNELLDSIVNEYAAQVKQDSSKKVEFLLSCNGPIEIDGDKDRITQVVHNLVANAVRFTDEGSVIIKAVKGASASDVVVSIKDSGTGIHPEIMPKLFSKFATKSEKGTGLGLYLARNIVEAHGGKIWAENNENGIGATFTFTVPIASKILADQS